jgi:CheY-like chemotaxis protein
VTAPRVLVVDDEEDVRLLLRMQLESNGFEVAAEAVDGEQALQACRVELPDAVILDLLMPVVNGFEAIPRLRREFPNLPIVAYTAVAGDFVRNEMARLHIPLVLKTANFRPIQAAIEQAMAQAPSSEST